MYRKTRITMNAEVTAREAWAMSPRLRKLALTAHVAFSVGWLGAVAAFLALSIAGQTSMNADVVRGAYLAMNVIGLAVIVPTSLAALVTGLIQGLGTRWGLFKYNWVTTKLALTILATALLMLHQFTAVAAAAKRISTLAVGALPDASFGALRTQLVVDASLAIAVLLVTTTLSIYKPWGLSAYGRRRQAGATVSTGNNSKTSNVKTAVVITLVLATIVTVHILKGGMHHH
jgi:hypothetical protein